MKYGILRSACKTIHKKIPPWRQFQASRSQRQRPFNSPTLECKCFMEKNIQWDMEVKRIGMLN